MENEPCQSFYRKNGIINISINYGLTPHPTQIKDVAKAVRWVYDNVEKYGGDKDKMGLMGYSGEHIWCLYCVQMKRILKQKDCLLRI